MISTPPYLSSPPPASPPKAAMRMHRLEVLLCIIPSIATSIVNILQSEATLAATAIVALQAVATESDAIVLETKTIAAEKLPSILPPKPQTSTKRLPPRTQRSCFLRPLFLPQHYPTLLLFL